MIVIHHEFDRFFIKIGHDHSIYGPILDLETFE